MKKNHLSIAIAMLFCTLNFGQNLILTGIYDGSRAGGTPKGVELYVLNNIDNLGIYGLGSANNGGGTDGEEFEFPEGVAVSKGTFIYIASEAEEFRQFFGFEPDYVDSAMIINGDDAVELFMNGVAIDVFGGISENGKGKPWEYTNGWAYRKNNTTQTIRFSETDWLFSGVDVFNNVTENLEATFPFPDKSYTIVDRPQCVFSLGNIATTCTTNNTAYSITIPFTNSDVKNYELTTSSGVISGDNPSNQETGSITILNLDTLTDVLFTIKEQGDEGCMFSRTISSPNCTSQDICPEQEAILITEIMQNPNAVKDDKGEYFELYNTSDTPVDLSGWVIRVTTASNTVEDSIKSTLIIPAKGYVVLGKNEDENTNGGIAIDYKYSANLFLNNSNGTLSLACNTTIFDEVSWTSAITFKGKSMELATDKYSVTANDVVTHWSEAVSKINPLDTNSDFGSPGKANDFVLSSTSNLVVPFSVYPNPVSNKKITVISHSSGIKRVSLYTSLGKKVKSLMFSESKKIIDLFGLKRGVYVLRVVENNRVITKKILIE